VSMFEDIVETVAPNTLVAVGVILLAPVLLPVAKTGLRPLAKGVVKGYLAIGDKVKEFAATTSEEFSDLYAEAKSEHAAAAGAASAKATEEEATREGKPRSGAGTRQKAT
jgi:Protein of unknown function (DUF5132)